MTFTYSTDGLTPGQRRTAAARAARAAAALAKMAERLEGAGFMVVHPDRVPLLSTVVGGYIESRPPGLTRTDVIRALRGEDLPHAEVREPEGQLVPLFSDAG